MWVQQFQVEGAKTSNLGRNPKKDNKLRSTESKSVENIFHSYEYDESFF